MGLANAYLLESAAGLALVDTGSVGQERAVLRRVAGLRRDDLRLIWISHAHLDHYGSAAALRRRTGAVVAIHRADGQAMARGETHLGQVRGRGRMLQALFPLVEPLLRPPALRADLLLEDRADLSSLGLEAVGLHTPGHTSGSSCLIVEGRPAFVDDGWAARAAFLCHRPVAHLLQPGPAASAAARTRL